MRINITGNSGSGKSTLSRYVATKLDLPLVEMDVINWQAGWKPTPSVEKEKKLDRLLAGHSWVVDGIYGEARQKADIIVLLDWPRHICLWRCARRNWRFLFRSRPGFPRNCPEILIVPKLLRAIKDFPKKRHAIMNDIDNMKGHREGLVVRSDADLMAFMDRIDLHRNTPNKSLRRLGREQETVATLDAVAKALAAFDREGINNKDWAYANARARYHSMRHDSEEIRHWVEETKRRVREETHGDRDVEATRHLYDASSLADAGLHKEAIEGNYG